MKYPTRILAVLVTAFALHLSHVRAADIYWTNTLGGNWSDAVNWSPNQVPGTDDNALITQDGTYTVEAINAVISKVFAGAANGTQTVTFSGVNLNLTGPCIFSNNAVLNLIGGAGNFGLGSAEATILIQGQMHVLTGFSAVGLPGSLTIASGARLNVDTSGGFGLNGRLTNAGAVVCFGSGPFGGASFVTGGGIYNLAGAIFEVQNDAPIWNAQFTAPRFYNAGLFRKSAGTGTTSINVPFNNTGTVDVQTGALNVGSSFSQAAGATLLRGGNVILSGTLPITGGLLGGSGQVFGNVSVSGQLSPGLSAGRVEIQGNYTQTDSGSYHVEIGGTTAGTAYDQVIIATNAQLAGTVNVCSLNGFAPAVGDRFEIMKFASMSGSVVFTGLNTANGVRLEPVITSTNIVLVATNASFNAAGIYWTNTLGGNWTDAANWSPNQVPGPADNAFIIQDGSYTVSVAGVGANNLIVGASCGTQTVVLSGVVGFYGKSSFASNTVLNVDGAYVGGEGLITTEGLMNLSGYSGSGGPTLETTIAVKVAPSGILNFDSPALPGAQVIVSGVITNAGRMNWVGAGAIRMNGLASIVNLAGGVFDVQNDQTMYWNIRGNATFYNAGLFRKSAGVGRTTFSTVPLYNTGTVDVQSGTLRFDGYGLFQTAGATLLNGGNLSFGEPFPAALQIRGGLLAGSGIVEANGTSVTVSGQFSPGQSAGGVEIQGNYIQKPSGSYNVEIGGTIAGMNYDQIVVTSNATLAGTINVCSINGFTPAPGDQFEIMKFGSMSGSVNFQGLDIAQGIYLQPVISATNIMLLSTTVPPVAAPRLHLARNGNSLWLWWPLGYGGFNLESTTNLDAPIGWSPVIPMEINRHIFTPTGPARFFREGGNH